MLMPGVKETTSMVVSKLNMTHVSVIHRKAPLLQVNSQTFRPLKAGKLGLYFEARAPAFLDHRD